MYNIIRAKKYTFYITNTYLQILLYLHITKENLVFMEGIEFLMVVVKIQFISCK